MRQEIRDGLGFVAGHLRLGKKQGQQAGPLGGDLVEVEGLRGAVAEGAFGHHGEHPGAGARFQHRVAGTDTGGLERRVGQRQGRGELLQADLLLGAARVRGLQRRERRQHGKHLAGAVGTGSGAAAHGPAVAAHEQDDRGLGRLVGILPEPGAFGVGRAERARHGVSERSRVEGPAGFQDGQKALCRGQKSIGSGGTRFGARGRRKGLGGGTRGGVGRGRGVEHGDLRMNGERRLAEARAAGSLPRAPPARPGSARRPPGGAMRGRAWGDVAGATRVRPRRAKRIEQRRRSARRRRFGLRGQPNCAPASVNVNSLAAMVSSTTASEDWYSYSRSSWR